MQIQVQLSPDTEHVLRSKASAISQTLEEYLKGIAEREARASSGAALTPGPLTSVDWTAEWRAWADADRKLAPSIEMDDSRESIYAGRGE